jgi:hypothetical protein
VIIGQRKNKPLLLEVKEKLNHFYNEIYKQEFLLFGPDFSFHKDKQIPIDLDGEEVKGSEHVVYENK